MPLPLNILYYGHNRALPEQIPLRAGPLTMIFENGDLRTIKLGDREIVRRLYVAIRNRNWDTAANVLSHMEMEIGADSFSIRYVCTNKLDDIDFVWRGELQGAADGTITCRMEGEARATFLRNRIGFCLLHPAAIAGAAARIEHVDGAVEENTFPVHIAPQHVVNGEIKPVAPFNEMAAVAHEVKPGVWASVRFTGDIFEMEDQRNWTDASYKTYGTPLRLAFPAEVAAGEKIGQTVTIGLMSEEKNGQQLIVNDQLSMGRNGDVLFNVGNVRTKLPRIGLGVASHGQPLSAQEIARLQVLKLSHLRVDLRPDEAGCADLLRQATAEAHAVGAALEVALHVTNNAEAELRALANLVGKVKPPVAAWLVFHASEKATSAQWVQLARQTLTASDAPIGAGTNLYFTELNRMRPPLHALDLVNWSINPQVHAFDNSSLVETLAAQATTVTSARQFCGDLSLRVSPVTLCPRFNPNATGPEPEPAPGELPPQVDPRQMSLFGAGWTLGSIKYLAEAGELDRITYYETTGWRGVMESAAGSPLPDKFPSIPGGVFPLYHVLADVSEFAGGEVIRSHSSQPLNVDGIALHKDGRTRVMLANFTAQPRQVTLTGLEQSVQVWRLDGTNVEDAMREPERAREKAGELLIGSKGALPLELPPFGFVRLDARLA